MLSADHFLFLCHGCSIAAGSDMVFTICFSLEAVFKVLAFGFRPYLSFFQNQVDFVIVVSSLAMLFLDTLDLEVIKVTVVTCK
jgi:hypothetical protein